MGSHQDVRGLSGNLVLALDDDVHLCRVGVVENLHVSIDQVDGRGTGR
jgi:hypothetical protein